MSKELHTAILKVMEQVQGVEKAGKMTSGGKYSYAQAEDVLRKIRPYMIDAGLTMCPVSTDVVLNEVYKTSSGSSMNRIVVRRTYRITHAPSGEHLDIQVLGEGSDVGDKACNKALTGAGKYARREAFSLEFGEDDPDKTPSAGMSRKTDDDTEPTEDRSTPKASAYSKAKVMIEKSSTFSNTMQLANGVFTVFGEGRLKKDQAAELMEIALDKLIDGAKDFAHAAQIQTLVKDALTDGFIKGNKYTDKADELAETFASGVE